MKFNTKTIATVAAFVAVFSISTMQSSDANAFFDGFQNWKGWSWGETRD